MNRCLHHHCSIFIQKLQNLVLQQSTMFITKLPTRPCGPIHYNSSSLILFYYIVVLFYGNSMRILIGWEACSIKEWSMVASSFFPTCALIGQFTLTEQTCHWSCQKVFKEDFSSKSDKKMSSLLTARASPITSFVLSSLFIVLFHWTEHGKAVN